MYLGSLVANKKVPIATTWQVSVRKKAAGRQAGRQAGCLQVHLKQKQKRCSINLQSDCPCRRGEEQLIGVLTSLGLGVRMNCSATD